MPARAPFPTNLAAVDGAEQEFRFGVILSGMTPRIEPPAELADRPFTTAQAIAAGLTRYHLRAQWVLRLLRGVYVYASTEVTLRLWIRAALLVLPPDSAPSHLTALRLHGVEVGPFMPLHFSTNTKSTCEHAEVVLHRRQGALNPSRVGGTRTLGPDRSFVDSSTPSLRMSFVQLVQAGDWLVHLGHTTVDTLITYCDSVHLDGVRRARVAARYVRDRVESPMETSLRLMLVFARLPEPACNLKIRDADGAFVARCDLVFVRYRLIVEYDGWWHRKERSQRRNDRRRIAALEQCGWTVVVVTTEDLVDTRAIVRRVHHALVDAGYVGPDPVFSVMWTRWFANVTI